MVTNAHTDTEDTSSGMNEEEEQADESAKNIVWSLKEKILSYAALLFAMGVFVFALIGLLRTVENSSTPLTSSAGVVASASDTSNGPIDPQVLMITSEPALRNATVDAQYWLDLHQQLILADGKSLPVRRGSPQFKALQWLAEKDPLAPLEMSSVQLQNRYALAVLYFSWNGPRRWIMTTPSNGWFRFVGAVDSQGSVTVQVQANAVSKDKEENDVDENAQGANNGLDGLVDGSAPSTLPGSKEAQAEEDNQAATQPPVVNAGEYPVPLDECDWLGITCDSQGRIVELDLSQDSSFSLMGNVPKELALLSHLQTLNLSKQGLKGRLPEALFPALKSLTSLNLSQNQFAYMDERMSAWNNLRTLILSGNNLQGSLPLQSMSQWSKLERLDLSNNLQLTGNLWQLVEHWPELSSLDISSTALSGSIPELVPEEGPLLRLESFYADASQLSGTLPASLYLASDLTFLSLKELEKISPRPFPTEFGKLTSLVQLSLFDSFALSGSLPTEIGLMTSLKSLDLFRMLLLRGTIPTEIGLLTNMVDLFLSNTNLSGTIPTEIGLLTDLTAMRVHITRLRGTMPAAVCDIAGLTELTISCASSTDQVSCPIDCCTGCS